MTTTKAPAKTTPKNLVSKLAEVMGLMAHIEKGGWNSNQKYRFVRESDVAEKASQLLAERNIFILQSVQEVKMEPLYESRGGMTMFLTTVKMGFQFVDGDSSSKTDILYFWGTGADNGDKGIYKAMTGAEKYFLMKTFLISTGDDPEADESTDKAAAGAAAGKGSKVKGGKAKAGTKRGGKTDDISQAQMSELSALVKEKGLTPPGFLALVAMTVEVPEGADANAIVKGLSSKDAATVIKALGELEESDEPEEPPPAEEASASEEAEQETMSIV
jgi:hypothetical protein